MKVLVDYFSNIIKGAYSLLKGMFVTGYYFTHPGEILTQQYPENRESLYIPDRFKARVVMPHVNNTHKCTGCTLCQAACPNGSIQIITATEELKDGKSKKRLDQWVYNLGSCSLCNQCIDACPTGAIKMDNHFELSVYEKKDLVYLLNQPGSRLNTENEIPK